MDYQSEVERSLSNSIFTRDDIFLYEGSPYKYYFSKFYNFCRENLDINSKDLGLDLNIFIYINQTSVNAFAKMQKKHSIIGIHSGLMIWGIENLLLNKDLNAFLNDKYPGLLKYFDNTVEVLHFQLSTQFTYYHELAHLIQLNNNKEFTLNEREVSGNKNDIERHWLEINADMFASIFVANHIEQYLYNNIGDDLDSEKSNDCTTIFGTCLFSYILSFASTTQKIYYFEKSHPHPIIRVFIILITVIQHLSESPKFKEKSISFSFDQVFNSIVNLHQLLEENNILNNGISQMIIDSYKEVDKIINYMKGLNNNTPQQYKDAIKEWIRIH